MHPIKSGEESVDGTKGLNPWQKAE